MGGVKSRSKFRRWKPSFYIVQMNMAKIVKKSKRTSGETSQSFNRFPFCTYLQTTDTSEIIAYQKNQRQVYLREQEPDTLLQDILTKKLQNWARRKITAQEIAYQLAKHEKQLPKEQRDLRNLKKSFNYQPIQKDGNVLLNRYDDVIHQPTTNEREKGQFYNLDSNVGNQRRHTRMFYCRQDYLRKVDKKTNKVVYRPSSQCGNKLCPNCNQRKSIKAIHKYLPLAEQMLDPVMLVLHAKSPKIGELHKHLDEMNNTLRSIFKVRAKSGKEHFFGILSLEITSNPTDETFHPHFHIIIERRFVDDLFNSWIEHKDNLIKDIFAHTHKKTKKVYSEVSRNDKGELNLNEVFKYVLKVSVSTKNNEVDKTKKELSHIKMVYEIDKVLSGKKTYRPFGKWSKHKKVIDELIEEKSDVEIPATHGFVGLADCWKWTGCDWEADNISGLMLSGFIATKKSLSFFKPNAETLSYYRRGIREGLIRDEKYLQEWEIEQARLLLEQ